MKGSHELFRAAFAAILPLLLALSGASDARAQAPPALDIPIECDLATLCSIQNYVDADRSEGATDFACGTLTYDGHKGTDFQVPDIATMRRGIAVLAAAGGIVRNTRDGIPDHGIEGWRKSGAQGKELGNAVAIVHGGGWETLYGHLRRGSVAVNPGDRIAAGQHIGLIGLSGKTEFPHLHLQVQHNGNVVDPFNGETAAGKCGTSTKPLWTPAAQSRLVYRPVVLICGGFAFSEPQRTAILNECPQTTSAAPDANALIVFAEVSGVQTNDRLRLRIVQPDGRPLIEDEVLLENTRSRQFQYVGRKKTVRVWQSGVYTARISLTRRMSDREQALLDVSRKLVIR